MQNSRDSYRNMLKVVNEGDALRKKLRSVKLSAATPEGDRKLGDVSNSNSELGQDAPQSESQSGASAIERHDSVTGLPGLDVFEGFFGEAWALGTTDSRPISVIIVRVDETNNENLRNIADELKLTAARTLDLVARVAELDFGLVLPDTDLGGVLAVANRLREALQNQEVIISIGVASIVPNDNGNPQSFLDVCQRAVAAAREKGDGQVAFVSEKGKLMLHQAPGTNSKPDTIDWETSEEASDQTSDQTSEEASEEASA